MIYLELTSEERWVLATAVSRQIGVYNTLLRNENYDKVVIRNIKRIEAVLSEILIALQKEQ